MKPNLHPDVAAAARHFKAAGLPTPLFVQRQGSLLLQPNFPGERVVIVIIDAVRCSSTLLASLAAGAFVVTVTTKNGDGGTTLDEARAVARVLGVELVYGGELHGKPIPGGVVGNSPRQVCAEMLQGRLLHFASTNFGAAYGAVQSLIDPFRQAGGLVRAFVGSFANCQALAAQVRASDFDRLLIACGGFYDTWSLEDLVCGGDLLLELGTEINVMDDACRVMYACALAFHNTHQRIAAFRSNWIGTCLERFGMAADIPAIVCGEGIPPAIFQRMQTLVPAFDEILGIPVIVPAGIPRVLVRTQFNNNPQEQKVEVTNEK